MAFHKSTKKVVQGCQEKNNDKRKRQPSPTALMVSVGGGSQWDGCVVVCVGVFVGMGQRMGGREGEIWVDKE